MTGEIVPSHHYPLRMDGPLEGRHSADAPEGRALGVRERASIVVGR